MCRLGRASIFFVIIIITVIIILILIITWRECWYYNECDSDTSCLTTTRKTQGFMAGCVVEATTARCSNSGQDRRDDSEEEEEQQYVSTKVPLPLPLRVVLRSCHIHSNDGWQRDWLVPVVGNEGYSINVRQRKTTSWRQWQWQWQWQWSLVLNRFHLLWRIGWSLYPFSGNSVGIVPLTQLTVEDQSSDRGNQHSVMMSRSCIIRMTMIWWHEQWSGGTNKDIPLLDYRVSRHWWIWEQMRTRHHPHLH